MLGFLLPLLFFAVILGLVHKNREPKDVLSILVAGYTVRMILQAFLRDLPVFSYGSGGDCIFYEFMAERFAQIWTYRGVEFFTVEQAPEVGNAALPINLFAFIVYLNGGPTRAGCTSLVAFCAVISCYLVYRLAVELGADTKKATNAMGVLLFVPGYLYYTSDMYKDSLVLFFVITALFFSFRLASRFSIVSVVLSLVSLLGLWYVRHYLVFLAVAPLVVGVVGIGKGSLARQLVFGVGVLLLVVVFLRSSLGEGALADAQTTFDHASNVDTRNWNQKGASGVSFDDGGRAFGALHIKIIYTLFSPFMWQGGSFAMQMGKLDTAVWYYFFYRAVLAGRRLWKEDRSTLLMFLVFLVPLTVAYATTMANIGLILRQRFPIVFVCSALGFLSWTRPSPWGSQSQRSRAS